jgi:arabinofuranan 3-O-arabinosyltransferase
VTTEFHEQQPIVMPAALAEVGIPGVQRGALPSSFAATCRDDLLTIDGRPVGIRLDGDPAAAAAGGAVDFALCDASVDLSAGDHVVRSAPGVSTGFDVDRLVLGSRAGGSAMTLGAGGDVGTALASARSAAAGGSAPTAPKVQVVENGRTRKEVRVTGAVPGQPFWLVLGESNSAGWRATVDDQHGSSKLVDGYANGWLISPAHGSFTVTLEWTPQRTVWIALAISAAALLLCVALVILWRKRRTSIDSPDLDGTVEFASPFARPDGRAGGTVAMGTVVVTAVVAGLAGAVLARWWVGLLAGVLTAAALLRPRARVLLALGAPAALALAALYVIVQQYRHRYAPDFFWLTHFDRVQTIAWLAVILLACDALVEVVRTRTASRDAPADASGELQTRRDVDLK